MSLKKRFYRVLKIIVLWRISSKAWSKVKEELGRLGDRKDSDRN